MKQSLITIIITLFGTVSYGQLNDRSFEATRGKWYFPIDYIQEVDTLTRDCYGQESNSLYLTLKTKTSTAVKSINDGAIAGVWEQYGIYSIMIKSGNYFLIYDGLAEPNLNKGDSIKRGTVIGQLAKSDSEENYCLNLILMKGLKTININRWFDWNCAQH